MQAVTTYPGENPTGGWQKAVVFHQTGDPSQVLHLETISTPPVGPGEARVRMLASPVNPSDLLYVQGNYTKQANCPTSPGFEGVGVVEEARGLLGMLLKGQRVAVPNDRTGNWREQVVLPARQLIPLGLVGVKGLPDDQIATMFVNPATAVILTSDLLRVPRGEWLLQTAAASTLGQMIVGLGKTIGFRTLNIVRRPDQAETLRALGADQVLICPDPATIVPQVMAITGGAGVKYALDPVAGATGSALVYCLAPGGRLVVYGSLSGEPLSFSPRALMGGGQRVEGFYLGTWMQRLGLLAKVNLLRRVGRYVRAGVLTSAIAERFPLARFADAIAAVNTPGRSGKVLLTMNEGPRS